jgi:hypothetical protein
MLADIVEDGNQPNELSPQRFGGGGIQSTGYPGSHRYPRVPGIGTGWVIGYPITLGYPVPTRVMTRVPGFRHFRIGYSGTRVNRVPGRFGYPTPPSTRVPG